MNNSARSTQSASNSNESRHLGIQISVNPNPCYMKKLVLTCAACLAVISISNAQTNTFPSTGYAGVGTTSPSYPLDIQGNTPGNVILNVQNNGAGRGLVQINSGSTSTANLTFMNQGTPKYSFISTPSGGLGFFDEGASSYSMFILPTTGNVGIGTTSPINRLHIKMDNDFSLIQRSANTNYAGHYYATGPDNAINYNFFTGLREGSDDFHIYNGEQGVDALTINHTTSAIGVGTASPGAKLEVNDAGYNMVGLRVMKTIGGANTLEIGNNFSGGSTFAFNAGIIGVSNGGLDIRDVGNAASRLVITPTGNVGIGTTDPGIYKLGVDGTIHSKAVLIDLNGWADYVFKNDYKLMPLASVKSYIDENHHLPEMPSAAEVEKEGLNIGEMNKLLTKKVEELTLYLFELKKENELLNQRIDKLENK